MHSKPTIREQVPELLSGARQTTWDDSAIIYGPDAKGYYEGIYWRDYYYTLQGLGEWMPSDEVQKAIAYLLDPLLTERLAEFPKGRTADGEYIYNWQYPGPPEPYFSADNPIFAVLVVQEHIRQGGSGHIFERYADLLEHYLTHISLSENHLVQDPVGPYIYGFYDTIMLTGEECFASVLWIQAADAMAEMYQQAGNDQRAEHWQQAAEKTRAALPSLQAGDGPMLLTDTDSNREIDVWGSAYAVWANALPGDHQMAISRWLVDHYEDCICRGHVRHLPKPHYFTEVGHDAQPPGHYQTGGFWAVPTPWVVYTLRLSDPQQAKAMQVSLRDGMVELDYPECLNEDGTIKLPGYLASIAMGNMALHLTPNSK